MLDNETRRHAKLASYTVNYKWFNSFQNTGGQVAVHDDYQLSLSFPVIYNH